MCPATVGQPAPRLLKSIPTRAEFRNRLCLLPESYNRAGLGGRAIGGPRLHQPPPLVEQVAAPVGRLGRVLDHVSKASFANLIGEIGAFGCPIA